MELPGEKLVLRLFETIEKSGTALCKPWQIKRIARAESEAGRETAISKLITEKQLAIIDASPLFGNQLEKLALLYEFKQAPSELLTATITTDLNSQIRKQLNFENALEKAKVALLDDSTEPPTDLIDIDWFLRWREYAAATSNELLQELWGNVLAGEVKKPGAYGLRTLDFLKNLSQIEAKKIEEIAPFIVNGYAIIFGTGLDVELVIDNERRSRIDFVTPPNYNSLESLEELGLINTAMGLGFSFGEPSAFPNGYFGWILTCHDKAVAATSLNKLKKLQLSFYKLTALGQDVLRLVKSTANQEYMMELANYFAREGFDSEIMDRIFLGGIAKSQNVKRIFPNE